MSPVWTCYRDVIAMYLFVKVLYSGRGTTERIDCQLLDRSVEQVIGSILGYRHERTVEVSQQILGPCQTWMKQCEVVSCVGTLMDRVHFPRILMTVFFWSVKLSCQKPVINLYRLAYECPYAGLFSGLEAVLSLHQVVSGLPFIPTPLASSLL